MSVEQIASSAKRQIDDLEGRVPRFWSNLTVDEISAVLRVVTHVFSSMHSLAKQGQSDNSQLLSDVQTQKVVALMDDLADNFFPMAHTCEPYQNLRIVSFTRFQSVIEKNAYDIDVLQELMQQIERLQSNVNSRLEEIESNAERLHEVFNP
jgi:hypothetical protein